MSVVELVDVGVKLAEQEPAASVQGDPVNVPPPPLLTKATVPEGIDDVPADVSATIAVHVITTLSVALPHVTLVEVVRFVVGNPAVRLPPAYVPSPE